MVKITFQSVAGQKVEKDNDVDKSEILIPHAMVSNVQCPRPSFITVIVCDTSCRQPSSCLSVLGQRADLQTARQCSGGGVFVF